MIRIALLISLLSLVGCKDGGAKDNQEGIGTGPEKDARLLADVYAWECIDSKGSSWQGAFDFEARLQYAPDGLPAVSLPVVGGCAYGLSMFPSDAGTYGQDIDNVQSPMWNTGVDSGPLERLADGYYYDTAFENAHMCGAIGDVVGSGMELQDAGDLTGAHTPLPGDMSDVTLNVAGGGEPTFGFGEDITVDWDAEGWGEAWVQLRRESTDTLKESVTCNASGLDSFVIDDSVWSLLTEDLPGVYTNVYVGFQNRDDFETPGGQVVEATTRAMHVAVLIE